MTSRGRDVALSAGVVGAAALSGVAISIRPVFSLAALLALGAAVYVAVRPHRLPVLLLATVFAQAGALGTATVSRLVGPLALGVVALGLATRTVPRLQRGMVLALVLLYGAWSVASVAWSLNPVWSLQSGTLLQLASLAIAVSYFLGCAYFVDDRAGLERLCRAFWVLSSAAGLIAIVAAGLGSDRSEGLVGDPNFFAMYQLMAAGPAVVAIRGFRVGWVRGVGWAGLAAALLSVVLSGSRGALVSLSVMGILLLAGGCRRLARSRPALVPATLVGVVALVGLLILVTPATLASDDLSDARGGAASRTNLWRAALTAVGEHPLQGIGAGAFQPLSNELLTRTAGVDLSDFKLRADGLPVHNAYLGSLAELGVVGLGIFGALLVAAAKSLQDSRRRARRCGDETTSAVASALSWSLLAFALGSLFLSSELSRSLWIVLGLTVAVAGVSGREARTGGSAPHPGERDSVRQRDEGARPRLLV